MGPVRQRSLHLRCVRQRSTSLGQALVEFALLGPLFFFVLLSTFDGGLLLYAKNAADHAADVGMVTIAAEGNASNPANPSSPDPADADQVAVKRMRDAGLGTTALVSVVSITVTMVVYDTSAHTFRDATSSDPHGNECTAFPCRNVYALDGSASQFAWPPANRSVSATDPEFFRLDVTYRYRFFATPQPALTITVTKLGAVEPQS